MSKKRLVIVLVAALVFSMAIARAAWAAPEAPKEKPAVSGTAPAGLETTAEAAVLLEPLTGIIVYEKEKDKRLPMASVTKLMTLFLESRAQPE